MKKQIISFIDDLKSNQKLSKFDEASTKQAVVLRLLSFLGWDIFNVDEVYPNYSANSQTVAYALRVRNGKKVFLEVKQVGESLESYQKQLLNFALQEGVAISILTNGVVWWFYLSSADEDLEQRRFASIDLLRQKANAIAPQFIDYLSKNNVSKGNAVKAAKAYYQSQKQKIAAETLPEAWNKILEEPNKIFVELLSETTEKLSGYKAEAKVIEKFISKHLDQWRANVGSRSTTFVPFKVKEPSPSRALFKIPESKPPVTPKKPELKPTPKKEQKTIDSYTDKSITSYSFDGRTYQARNWEDMLTNLCDILASIHNKDFEKVLWISGKQSTHFSRYDDQLNMPEKIKNTDIYVETKLPPDEVVKTARFLLAEFGYQKADLTITTQ